MGATPGSIPIDSGAVRRCASDQVVYVDAQAGPYRARKRPASDGRCCLRPRRSSIRCSRRDSADAAWYRAAGGTAHREPARADARALYANSTLADADRTARFIAGSYAGFHHFPMFAAYSMFYFAAASSARWRGGSSRARPRSLWRQRPIHVRAGATVTGHGRHGRSGPLRREVASAIADWNIAVSAIRKKNWAWTSTSTTRFAGRRKLGLTPEARCAIVWVRCLASRLSRSSDGTPNPGLRVPESGPGAIALRLHRHLLADQRRHSRGSRSHVAAA